MPESEPAAQSTSSPEPFVLLPEQHERLLALRAAKEEGEGEERLERLRQREEDEETLRSFAQQLADVDFAHGGSLTRSEMAHLLALSRRFSPNPNLDARLLRRPDEPETMNQDLRDLLYGAASTPLRIRQFLTRRHAGGQTALQLLCAAFPTQWPLVTPMGLRALDLTPDQRQSALETARQRFDLPHEIRSEGSIETRPGVPASDPVLRLLGQVIVYETVRDTLESTDFVAVHRLLTQGTFTQQPPSRRFLLRYSSTAPPGRVREAQPPEYIPQEIEREGALPTPEPPDLNGMTHSELLIGIERYIAALGFTYPSLAVRDYYLCLQSRSRLTILSGLSGTGKSRLTSLFAEALTGNVGAQYRLLPVRPDWADSTPLLGYMNLLAGGGEGRFVATPFLDFLRRASRPENALRAFLICLDEMNLARVEHYFAEVLSAMETPSRELTLPNGRALRLPANLCITGTLNIDEGTQTLSRKVLDRANTIIFNEVSLDAEEPAPQNPDLEVVPWAPEVRQALFLLSRTHTPATARAKLKQVSTVGIDFATRVVDTLSAVNAILEPHDMHFAYRVRDEILIYCANSFDVNGAGLLTPDRPGDAEANLRIALDLQLIQKALPRLTGSQEQIEAPARDLLRWAKKAPFPQTIKRLTRLLARLQRDGFTGLD